MPPTIASDFAWITVMLVAGMPWCLLICDVLDYYMPPIKRGNRP